MNITKGMRTAVAALALLTAAAPAQARSDEDALNLTVAFTGYFGMCNGPYAPETIVKVMLKVLDGHKFDMSEEKVSNEVGTRVETMSKVILMSSNLKAQFCGTMSKTIASHLTLDALHAR